MEINLDSKIPQLKGLFSENPGSLSPSFWSWRDGLYQSRWGFYVFPTETQAVNMMRVVHKLMLIQQYFPTSTIRILSFLRTKPYNVLIGGSLSSAHCEGLAVDFYIEGLHSSVVRRRLASELEYLDIRMERLSDTDNWVHIDLRDVAKGQARYFNP